MLLGGVGAHPQNKLGHLLASPAFASFQAAQGPTHSLEAPADLLERLHRGVENILSHVQSLGVVRPQMLRKMLEAHDCPDERAEVILRRVSVRYGPELFEDAGDAQFCCFP